MPLNRTDVGVIRAELGKVVRSEVDEKKRSGIGKSDMVPIDWIDCGTGTCFGCSPDTHPGPGHTQNMLFGGSKGGWGGEFTPLFTDVSHRV